MYVIEVTPLIRGSIAGQLSYYSGVSYDIGSIITVPLRKKNVQAMVTDASPVSKAKTALKAATFSLRKLEIHENVVVLPESIINTAKELTKIYPATLGSILYALLPPDIRSGVRSYPETTSQIGQEDPTPFVYTGLSSDRYLVYKSRIREAFAHRASVLMVVPNSVAVSQAAEKLSHGIEKRVITLSSIHTKRQIESSYKAVTDLSSAKLIITTPNFAMLDRHDITTIIVDECGSPHYKTRTRPYLDSRDVLKTYAKVSRKSILLGDNLPQTEDEHRRREEIYQTLEEHPKRLQFTSSFELARHDIGPDAEFSIITPRLEEFMSTAIKNKGRVFLFAPRKGLAPLVTCYDCGHVFRCADSGAPFSLFRTFKNGEEERWFVCSTSGRRERAADVCPDCGSWRLREQGVGIQQVEDAVKEKFPKSLNLKLDHETASTHKKAEKIVTQFYETKGSILIGTTMALPFLTKAVDVTAVTSYEAFRSIPTWRAEEQTLSTLLKIREITAKDCVIQHRTDEDGLLKISRQALIDQFYDEEIEIRQAVKYPPFAYFVLMTYTGQKDQVVELETYIHKLLTDHKVQSYSTPVTKPNTVTRHTLVRVKSSDWPNIKLMDTLRTLPPQVKLEVNPMRIV